MMMAGTKPGWSPKLSNKTSHAIHWALHVRKKFASHNINFKEHLKNTENTFYGVVKSCLDELDHLCEESDDIPLPTLFRLQHLLLIDLESLLSSVTE